MKPPAICGGRGSPCKFNGVKERLPSATLNFSRGTAPIAVQAYMLLRLGRDGYTRIMRHTLDNAVYLRQRLVDSGYFDIMNEFQRIPVVALTLVLWQENREKRVRKRSQCDC